MDSRSFEIQQKKEVSAQIQRDTAAFLLRGGKIKKLPYRVKSNLDDIGLTDRQKKRLKSLTGEKSEVAK